MLKVVILEKIRKNWDIGSVVSVKNGFARNYLIPTGKAKIATKDNIKDIISSLNVKNKLKQPLFNNICHNIWICI